MEISEYEIKKASIQKEIDKIDELLKKLESSFNNEYLDDRAKKDAEKYRAQRHELLLELNEIENKHKVEEQLNNIKIKEAHNDVFNKLNIDPKNYEHILENVILSNNYEIKFKDDYIVITDPKMLIRMPDDMYGVSNIDDSDLKKLRKHYGWNINFKPGHPYDFVEKYGKIWLRKYAWVFINKFEHDGDYGKVKISKLELI